MNKVNTKSRLSLYFARKRIPFTQQQELLAQVQAEAVSLAKMPPGPDRAKHVHSKVEEAYAAAPPKNITCYKGCSGCCHQYIPVTSDEADLLAEIVRNGHPIDEDQLRRQDQIPDDILAWWQKTTKEETRCVFLDESGACSIYENRPSVCRLYTVEDDAWKCDKEQNPKGHPSKQSYIPHGEILSSAAQLVNDGVGNLAKMLYARLTK